MKEVEKLLKLGEDIINCKIKFIVLNLKIISILT